MKKIVGIFIVFSLVSCLKEDELNKGFAGFAPKEIGDGWELGNCSENNVDSAALLHVFREVYDNDERWTMKSLSVFRNNTLLAESYLKNENDRIKPQAVWSCTKQVMGLLAGVMFDDHEIFMSDRIEQFIPQYLKGQGNKKNILIGDLLTMRSGLAFHNNEHTDVYRKRETDNSVSFALGLDLEFPSGSRFNYNDGDPQIFSAIAQQVYSQKADITAKERIFDAIGFTNYEWKRYPKDGITMGGFGILTTPRELAKIGQLVLNGGSWDSTVVISETYIESMLSVQSKVDFNSSLKFGYYWWIHPAKNYYFMWGHGGQYVFLLPEKDAMVVITSLEQIEDDKSLELEDALGIVDQIKACLY